ncbi:2-acyl-glycerophospho-ethanolamine acyltransferase [Mesorhizobium microcysteis]|uniref:2-acyl-glycerophospho-ethanolamine acyltransferase n=1 Tax=Neoaquamicrobium microcysteis TaxID=2682781 RepID=A0A5D4GX15_9HYPH|nr:1-acyl-sn-glycerol-3-phosphate acyltransferase [Mesorhizobium microcysteis]TYR32797.1 2-acyl-glycerophospho-ethanolamine acyltransferase [Mesorhizobium microcysteis]
MILAGLIVAGIATLWLAAAAWLVFDQKISFRQAILHAPLALVWRIDGRSLRNVRNTTSVIYVVSHQSRLDPALMLALLPEDTLHILDERSAKAGWLEPWRSLARTIAFNPEHVFVSRRLVRVLRGGGKLCVYMPPDVEPDTREFRLYRAVARIALRAEAKVVPIHVAGSRNLPFSLLPKEAAPRRLFPALTVHALPPATISELVTRYQPEPGTSSGALYGRVTEVRNAELEKKAA